MTVLSRIDNHCHLFNIFYLLKEMATMACDVNYRISDEIKNWLKTLHINGRNFTPDVSGLHDFLLEWLFDVWKALIKSEASHYRFIVQAAQAKQGWEYKTHTVFPLMMDIYYMAAAPCLAARVTPDAADRPDPGQQHARILGIIKEKFESTDSTLIKPLKPRINSFLRKMKTYPRKRTSFVSRKKATTSEIPFYSWGFRDHLLALRRLRFWNKGKVYPFFAIDPRRPGVMQMMRKYVSKKGPFYGIKLYTYLGYKPDYPGLQDVYRYCEDRDLPIIVHCNKEGFPPLDTWPYIDYADPILWEPILKKHRKLRLDFAHMGINIGSSGADWTKTILAYINSGDYPNVYTDISCFSVDAQINKFLAIWKDPVNARVKERVMFGTDYVVMLLSGLLASPDVFTTLKQYFRQFKDQVPFAVLQQIAVVNPRQFMNI